MKESAYKIKNYSTDAVISCVLGGIALFLIVVSVIMSFAYSGKGPAMIGLMGIASLLLSSVGMVFMVSSWKSVEGGLTMKRICAVMNGVAIIISVIFYLAGWL